MYPMILIFHLLFAENQLLILEVHFYSLLWTMTEEEVNQHCMFEQGSGGKVSGSIFSKITKSKTVTFSCFSHLTLSINVLSGLLLQIVHMRCYVESTVFQQEESLQLSDETSVHFRNPLYTIPVSWYSSLCRNPQARKYYRYAVDGKDFLCVNF